MTPTHLGERNPEQGLTGTRWALGCITDGQVPIVPLGLHHCHLGGQKGLCCLGPSTGALPESSGGLLSSSQSLTLNLPRF